MILFLGNTFAGYVHDYTMLKEEFPPEMPWFECLKVLADLGYQGLVKEYVRDEIELPYKKQAKPRPYLDRPTES